MRPLPARINDKPQYVFHPVRLLRRALHGVRRNGSGTDHVAVATLPWGLELEVHSGEAIGYTILTAGVFDPCVTETLHRLIDPGDLVVDVGANVGYITSLAAARAGAGGEVIAYEPHPGVFGLLQRNAGRWRAQPGIAEVQLHQAAVSEAPGTAELASGPRFGENMGVAALRADDDTAAGIEGATVFRVDVRRLDDALPDRPVGLLKIDVEGHELGVLRGAQRLMRAGVVRDIVFEDHEPYPDACTTLVQDAGYTLFALQNDLFGVQLGAPERRGATRPWPGPSYLATRDPERAVARMRPRGWRVAGIGPTPWWRGRRGSPGQTGVP
jgi:FkbM family methyltransferase